MDALTMVGQVISDKVSQGEMFTALNVSRVAQAAGLKARHNSLKHITHASFEDGEMAGYTRTLITVGGFQAWLYHEPTADISEYDGDESSQPSSQASIPTMAPATIGIDDDDEDDDGDDEDEDEDDSTDARGRVCIPVSMLNDLGLIAGDKAHVVAGVDQLVLKARPPSTNGDKVVVYQVDKSGNVRISKSRMKNLLGGSRVVRVCGDEVIIT